MSSAAGKTPAPGQAVYSASKFALNGYFHTLRSEVLLLSVMKFVLKHLVGEVLRAGMFLFYYAKLLNWSLLL